MHTPDHNQLFQVLQQGVIYFQPNGQIVSANPAALSILGLSLDQMLGLIPINGSWRAINEDGSPLASEFYPVFISLRTGEPVLNQTIGLLKPNADTPLWLNICTHPIFKSGGTEIDVVIATLEDISERIHTDKALQESYERFGAIANTSPIGILIHRDNQMVYLNPEAISILGGKTEDHFIGKPILSIVHPSFIDMALSRISTAHQLGATKFSRMKFLDRAGSPIDVEVRGVSTKLNGKSVILVFFTDISDRLHAEGQLRLLSDITDNAVVGVAIIKAMDSTIYYTNKSFHTMLGYDVGELIGQPISIINAPTQRSPEEVAAEINGELLLNKQWQGEVLNLKKDGTPIWTHANIFSFDHVQLGPLWITYQRDITARKALELSVADKQRELEGLLQQHVAAQTAAAIAHELNQPLLAISAYSETIFLLLNNDRPNLEKIKIATEATRAQSLRAGKAIRDMLEFLREPGFATDTFNICRLVDDAVTTCKTEHRLPFEFILHRQSASAEVHASRLQIQKVVLNLLHNSADAMQTANTANPTITITVKDSNTHALQVTVQDNGPGIPADVVPHLFEQFFSTKKIGIGMGLSISRSLIEANHGELWFEANAGVGATFHFTLPIATSD